MINDPIDTPFSGTKFFDALLSNEEYLERYHASDIDIKAMGQFNMGGNTSGSFNPENMPDFGGSDSESISGQTSNQTIKNNLILFGSCLAAAVVVLCILVRSGRRK